MALKLVYEYERQFFVDSYGQKDFYEGDPEVYRVWQLDDGERHFKQLGRQGSFDRDPTWKSDMEEVIPMTKNTTVYDYEGL